MIKKVLSFALQGFKIMRIKILLSIVFALIILGIIFFMFYPRTKNVEELYLHQVKAISSTPDSIIKFFSSVSCFWFDEDNKKLYVSDPIVSCIAIFDTNLNFLGRIGKMGKGPEEFETIDCISKFNDLLFVYVPMGIKLLRLNGEKAIYLTSFRVPWFSNNKFAISSKGNLIIPASPESDSLLAVYDTTGMLLNLFGKRIEQESKQRTFLKNGVWPVVDEEGNIYSVFLSLPYIRKYSRDFKLLIEKRLSDEVKYGLKIIEKKKRENPNIRWSMVGGVYYRKPYLYVRYASEQPPVICVYDGKTLELKRKLVIKDVRRTLSNFAVISDRHIVSYDMRTGELVKYEIEYK